MIIGGQEDTISKLVCDNCIIHAGGQNKVVLGEQKVSTVPEEFMAPVDKDLLA